MSLAQDIKKVIDELLQTKSYGDAHKYSVLELYTRAASDGHEHLACQHLDAAYEAENYGKAIIQLGAALRALPPAPTLSPPAPTVRMGVPVISTEMNVGGHSSSLIHTKDGDIRVHAVDEVFGSSTGAAENDKAETKRNTTPKRGEPLKPTSHELQTMRETLDVLADRWESFDGTRFGHTKPDPENKDRKLPTIKLKDGSVVVLYRSVCLHTSEKYEILPHGKMNLERPNSRQSKLWEDNDTLVRLGLLRIDETDEMDTNIGLIDSHKYPDHKEQRGYSTRKVLALRLVGATETQIRDTPSVSIRGGTVTLDLHKYIETELLPTLQHQAVAPKFESDEKVPVKTNKWPTKRKSSSAKGRDTGLRIRQDLCSYKEKRLDNLVTFLESPLMPSELNWFKEAVIPSQELRDKRLLAAIKTENRNLTHHALERVHRKCTRDCDGEVHCEFGSLEECRHNHCPGVECKSETLLMKGCWYMIDLCDTVDHKTGLMKNEQRKKRDKMKVHPHSNRTQTTSMQVYYKTWRDFCEWYTIAVYDLLGGEQFGDQQATVPSLMYSPHLVSLVEEFIGGMESSSPSTKHNKIKQIKDIMDSGAAYTFMHLYKGTNWLDEERKKNLARLEVLLKKYSQDGATIRRNTDLRLSSTATGKAPGFDRVDGAFRHHREGLFSKIKCQKGKGIVPVAVQYFLLLAFIRSLLGARPGMYAHMAFGTNLKSVNMLKSNKEVNHQKAKRKKSTKNRSLTDREYVADSYAKGIALEYLKVMKDRVPAVQQFELKYHILLEATTKKRYGYKNGPINSRILPFHRHRSMLLIVYAASVLYVRKGTPDDVATQAGEFLQYYEASRYDTDSAYEWLEDHGQVDFVRSLCEHHGNSCRVFYRNDEEFRYGSHADDSSNSQSKETAISNNVTKMVKAAMRMYYGSLEEGEIVLDELCDGTLDWVEFVTSKGDQYTTRDVRSATADHISRLFPDMPYEVKELLVEQTMMHTLETHSTVYVRDVRFMRCLSLRDWMERGAPRPEFEKVMGQTTDEIKLGDFIHFSEPPVGVGMNELGGSVDEGSQEKGRLPDSSAARASIPDTPDDEDVDVVQNGHKKRRTIHADAADDTVHIPALKSKDRRNPLEDKVNGFLRHSPLLEPECTLELMTGSDSWQTFEVTYRSNDDGRGAPYVKFKGTRGSRKVKDLPDMMLWWPVFETWGNRVKLEDNRTWSEHVAAAPAT